LIPTKRREQNFNIPGRNHPPRHERGEKKSLEISNVFSWAIKGEAFDRGEHGLLSHCLGGCFRRRKKEAPDPSPQEGKGGEPFN